MSNHSLIDSLGLNENKDVRQIIEAEGLSEEKVIFSGEIKKINAKGKKQMRVMMITQSAIYNLKKNQYKNSQRRIEIGNIGMLTLSASSPEFVIHIPSEYDYHFISKQKDEIAQLLKDLFFKQTMSKLAVVYSPQKHLKDIVLTKKLAKFESHEDKQTIKKSMIKHENENKNDDIDVNDEQDEKIQDMVIEPGSPGSSSHNPDPPQNDKNNVAIYQSVVYGNDQLLLQQNQNYQMNQQNQMVYNQHNYNQQHQQNQMNQQNQQNQMQYNQQNQMQYNQQNQQNQIGDNGQNNGQIFYTSLNK